MGRKLCKTIKIVMERWSK